VNRTMIICTSSMKAPINLNCDSLVFETNLKIARCHASSEHGGTVMLTREQTVQSKLIYRGYDLEVRRAPSGWRVGIYPRTADLPILSRSEVAALDQDEAVVIAKDRVDGVISL
jgi:hypothetical protein